MKMSNKLLRAPCMDQKSVKQGWGLIHAIFNHSKKQATDSNVVGNLGSLYYTSSKFLSESTIINNYLCVNLVIEIM